MSRIRLQRLEAIVLKRRDHGEADRILTLYTPARGKIAAIAKGVRRPTSRKAGHVEPLAHVALLLATGRAFDVVTQAEVISGFPGLRQSLERTTYACHVAELIDRLTPDGEPQPALFHRLRETLTRLDDFHDPALAVRAFECRLLDALGYRPELSVCVECGQSVGPEGNRFHAGLGGVVCPACGRSTGGRTLPAATFKVLRFLQGNPWSQAAGLELTRATGADLAELMRGLMAHLMERDLASARFMDEVATLGFPRGSKAD